MKGGGAVVTVITAAALVSACAAADPVAQAKSAVVYGADDRMDYFDLDDPAARALVAGGMVALIANQTIQSTGGDLTRAPTWAQANDLCPGEPFADQPAAAFCSGILVDWDLVLTAGHCARLYALEDFQAVLGYYYDDDRRLAVRPADIIPVAEIVNEELDPAGSAPRLDYAWLRLRRPVAPPRHPIPLRVAPPSLTDGDRVIAVGAGGGVPLKWDAGGRVQDAGSTWLDYFVADADNSSGSSGGGAFDASLALVGVTSRGSPDFMPTATGCNTTVRQPGGATAGEQFTYAFRAAVALCAAAPLASTICRTDCGDPCQALPMPPEHTGGCAVAGVRPPPGLAWLAVAIMLLAGARWRRPRAAPDADHGCRR